VPRQVDASTLEVDLPAGGKLHLLDTEEVELWVELARRYQKDYKLRKINDQATLGTILMHHLTLFRAQRGLSGLEPEYDEDDLFTGEFKRIKVTQTASAAYTMEIQRASKEIREQEKTLGIDKRQREAAGDQDVANWISHLKRFGREMGIHIHGRVHAYELFVNELRWRLRLEQVGDAEDRTYHDCTPEGILKWANDELVKLAEIDKEFAAEKQRLVVGKL
jgi:hypothetical protein